MGGNVRFLADRGLLVGFAVTTGLLWTEAALSLQGGNPYPYSIILTTLLLAGCMVRLQGTQGTLIFLALILAIPFASEFPGVLVGIPFGAYHYGTAPGPKVLGVVPIFIYLAWVAIVYPVVITTTLAFGRLHPGLAVVDGAAATAWDVMVDPQAVQANFWSWDHPGPFYGIPLSNFLGWFGVVALTSITLRTLFPRTVKNTINAPLALAILPSLILLQTSVKYAVLAVHRGFPLAAALGTLALLPYVYLALRRARGPTTAAVEAEVDRA